MIKDYAIRHFIFKQFIKNIRKDLRNLSSLIFSILRDSFLKNEEVVYKNNEGLIFKKNKDKYYVLLKKDYSIIKCLFSEIRRKYKFDSHEIFEFLHFITYDTPLGCRLLKRNIYNFCNDKSSIREYLTFLKKSNDFENVINSEDYKNTKNEINYDITKDIPFSEIYEIEGFDFMVTSKVLRIYSFIYNFSHNKILLNVSINKLVRSFKEQPYVSEIIGGIHAFLIENILEEKKSLGFNLLLNNIKNLLETIQGDFVSDEVIIGNEVGVKGWKLKTRTFLLEIYKTTKNRKILSFYNVLNKKSPFSQNDTIVLRILLVEFLINCYMVTSIFREIILNEIKKVKALETKAIELNKIFKLKIDENSDPVSIEEIKNRLFSLKKKIVMSPAKADLGILNGAKFFLVDGEIYLSKNKIIYVPTKETMEKILQKYEIVDKIEINTTNNIKNILESLYLKR